MALQLKGQNVSSLVVQWLRLWASNAKGEGWIPGRGTKIPHAKWENHKCKKKHLK